MTHFLISLGQPCYSGDYVATIFSTDSTASDVACVDPPPTDGVKKRTFDKTTEKARGSYFGRMCCLCHSLRSLHIRFSHATSPQFFCNRNSTALEPTGIVVHPSHERLSIAKKLRVYAHNNCYNCDAISYIVSGRLDASNAWVPISSGDLPWKDAATDRNPRGQTITGSTYEAVAPGYEATSTEVEFLSNEAAFLEYKIQFPEIRSGDTIQ